MDYKEKYEQLTQFIKDLYPHMSDYCKEKTEGMIPEIRESKNNRIRKALIELVRMVDKNPIHQIFGYGDIKYSDMIAWLESQGEQKPTEWTEEDESIRKECLSIVDAWDKSCSLQGDYCEAAPRCIAWLDKLGRQKLLKQGEQKQYDIDILEKHITKDSISELAHTVIVRNGWEIVDAKEQNTAWTEEDERILNSIIEELMPCGECPDYPTDEEREYFYEANKKIDWLKSIKPQPKQKWSEEDEKLLHLSLESLAEFNKRYGKVSDCIYWLKSIKKRTKGE